MAKKFGFWASGWTPRLFRAKGFELYQAIKVAMGNHMKKRTLIASAVAASFLAMSGGPAAAAGIEVDCEYNAVESDVDVEGFALARGRYQARISSGMVEPVWSRTVKLARRGRVKFEFESDVDDIRRGDTRIPVNFIQNSSVTGELYRVTRSGRRVLIGTLTQSCVQSTDDSD